MSSAGGPYPASGPKRGARSPALRTGDLPRTHFRLVTPDMSTRVVKGGGAQGRFSIPPAPGRRGAQRGDGCSSECSAMRGLSVTGAGTSRRHRQERRTVHPCLCAEEGKRRPFRPQSQSLPTLADYRCQTRGEATPSKDNRIYQILRRRGATERQGRRAAAQTGHVVRIHHRA